MIFPSDCRGGERDARTPASSHLALIPRSFSRMDDVPSVKGLTSVWVSKWGEVAHERRAALGQGSACTRRLGNCKHGPWVRGEAGLAGDAQAEVIEANLSSG